MSRNIWTETDRLTVPLCKKHVNEIGIVQLCNMLQNVKLYITFNKEITINAGTHNVRMRLLNK